MSSNFESTLHSQNFQTTPHTEFQDRLRFDYYEDFENRVPGPLDRTLSVKRWN